MGSEGEEVARPRQIGDFLLLEEIGRGGMGRVYRAQEVSSGREVALKVLPSFAGADADSVKRFQREADAAGRLSHPGIVPIYSVGEVDGTYYYAMELVKGPSVFQLLDSLRVRPPGSLVKTLVEETELAGAIAPPDDMAIPAFLAESLYPASCAALILDVAGALTVAHQNKVIHRDIKPSNILWHSDGHAVLVDFGLARDELQLSMTQTGDAVGTPSYMAPEQAAGSKNLDSRVDIYGIGASLYELLTLRPPFQGAFSGEIMQAILDKDPVPPRKLNPRVPRDLDTIVLTCLAKDPDQRYNTTCELQSDLRAFLAGTKIRARPPGILQIIKRRVRRDRRSAVVAAVSVLCVLAIGLMAGLVSLNNTRQTGRLALDDAKILLLAGKARESHAEYMHAQVLLEDAKLVSASRLWNFRDVFEVMYGKRQFGVLGEFLDNLPDEEGERSDYREFRRRLAGIGRMAVGRDSGREIHVWVRGVVDEEFERDWRRLPPDGWLSVGQYLVRLESRGMAPLVQTVEVSRDQSLTIEPRFRPTSDVPARMRLVAPADGTGVFAVDRTEFTVGDYDEFLRSLPDRELATEMTPVPWSPESRTSLPVTGLSYRQVRTAAALLGGHLMSRDEFLYAATGGLRELPYPWGRRFDLNRVVGDPRYTTGLAQAVSKPEGASPIGILNLVGNAGEPLSASGDGSLFVGGGHYLSTPADLTVHSLIQLMDPNEQQMFVGLRVARFLAEPDSPEIHARIEARVRSLSSGAVPGVASTWTILADGSVSLRQVLTSKPGTRERLIPHPRGFRTVEMTARAERGSLLEVEPVREARFTGYEVRLPVRSESVRIEVERALEPLSGLFGFCDSYYFRMPLSDLERESTDRVNLPVGCRVDEVWPAPDARYHVGGAPVLVWHRGKGQAPRGSARTAVIRFRRDGAMTARWPVFGAAERTVVEMFTALRRGSTPSLSMLLAEDCRFYPQDWGKKEILRKVRSLNTYSKVEVDDVIAIGDVLTVEARVEWRSSAALRVQASVSDWPIRIILQRIGARLEIVRLMPSARRDLGSITAGQYTHKELRVEVTPVEGVSLARSVEGVVEMQLEFVPASERPERGLHRATLVGCLASGNEDAAAVRTRLTAGNEVWRRGERLPGSETLWIGSEDGSRMAGASEHWLFRSRDGKEWTREQWTFLLLGHRHVLLRFVAVGSSRVDAQRRFSAQEAWFASISGALRIY